MQGKLEYKLLNESVDSSKQYTALVLSADISCTSVKVKENTSHASYTNSVQHDAHFVMCAVEGGARLSCWQLLRVEAFRGVQSHLP